MDLSPPYHTVSSISKQCRFGMEESQGPLTVLDMPSPAIPLQKEVILQEDKMKIKQAVASREEDAGAGAGTSPWSQDIFITILTHQTDLDHK